MNTIRRECFTEILPFGGKSIEECIIDNLDSTICLTLDEDIGDWFEGDPVAELAFSKQLLDKEHWIWTRVREVIEDNLYTRIKYIEAEYDKRQDV